MNDLILLADWKQFLIGPLMGLTAIFLILVVLVQRGRGGGLTGALGGAGGQSAFGAKAGDVFTRITVVVASFWILLCILAVLVLQNQGTSKLDQAPADQRRTAPEVPGSYDDPDAEAPAETDLQLDADDSELPDSEVPRTDTPAVEAPRVDPPPVEPDEEGQERPVPDAPAPLD